MLHYILGLCGGPLRVQARLEVASFRKVREEFEVSDASWSSTTEGIPGYFLSVPFF